MKMSVRTCKAVGAGGVLKAPYLHGILAATLAIILLLSLSSAPDAAAPPSGSISPDTATALTWVGTATGGASNHESTCVEGVNCDTFKLTVTGSPADYAGKVIVITFNWVVPVNDYNFFIRKDAANGPVVGTGVNSEPPRNADKAEIYPSASGTGDYFIRAVYESAVGDQYRASASLTAATNTTRSATYIADAIKFSPNVPLKAPVNTADAEPSNRTDFQGNCYVAAIDGIPSGSNLWYLDLNPSSATFDPFMRVPSYRGKADELSPSGAVDLGADGGGDIDLSVGFAPPSPSAPPILAFSSLVSANISTGNSLDRAITYHRNPAGTSSGGLPIDDRQWQEALGSSSVYLYYRAPGPVYTQVQRSNDGGVSYGPAQTIGSFVQTGPIDVHQASGTVYAPDSRTGVIAVGTPATPGGEPLTTDYIVRTAARDANGVGHIFFITKVADDGTPNGTLYACYSNGRDVFLKSSTDKAITWTDPVRVNDGVTTKTNIFPWMETGPLKGSVGVAWYGTAGNSNGGTADWKVYYATSMDADGATPTIHIAEVTEPEHYIHAGKITEGGGGNRNLLDLFQVSFDPLGAAVISYADDHNDFGGNTFVARQISGPSVRGGLVAAPVEGAGLVLPAGTANVEASEAFPPRQPGLNGEQVTDFALDVAEANIGRVKLPDPTDIVSVRYDSSGTGASLAIAATMKVSDLSTIPAGSVWMMNFAANAPHSVLSATGTYSYGLSDRTDQFYLQADTFSGRPAYSYGKAVRNPDGSLTFTRLGAADTGSFHQAAGTISVQVSAAKLNAALPTDRAPITNGSVIAGLRAATGAGVTGLQGIAAFRRSIQGRIDYTYGGTQFVVHDSAFPRPAAIPTPTPLPNPAKPPAGPTPEPVTLANISTRVAVKTGDQVGIGGFIVRGTKPKRVMIRGIGPSLDANGTALATLSDPMVELRDSTRALLTANGNWRGPQEAEITASGLAPAFDQEAAIVAMLSPGDYTAIFTDAKGGTGTGLIEVYDIDAESLSDLGNISTRGNVGAGDDVLIGGFIIRDNTSRNSSQTIVVRALGPSLTSRGVAGALENPTIDLHDANGAALAFNDDWRDTQQTELEAASLAPESDREAAILAVLAPGAYTGIVRGKDGTTGVGLVETYNLGEP